MKFHEILKSIMLFFNAPGKFLLARFDYINRFI